LVKVELERKENEKLYHIMKNNFSLIITSIKKRLDIKVIEYLLSNYIKKDIYSERYTLFLMYLLGNKKYKELELFFKHGFNINSIYTFDKNEINLFRYTIIENVYSNYENNYDALDSISFLLNHGFDTNKKISIAKYKGDVDRMRTIDYILYIHFNLVTVKEPPFYNIIYNIFEFYNKKKQNNENIIKCIELDNLLPSIYLDIIVKDDSFKIIMLVILFCGYENFKKSRFFNKLIEIALLTSNPKFIHIIEDEQMIIDKYSNNSNGNDIKNSNILFTFIFQHQLNGIKMILEHNKNLINARDFLNQTPLMYAADHCIDYPEILDYLMKYNPNLNAVCSTGDTALHIACECNNSKAIPYLLTSKNINLKNLQNYTPVMTAITCKHYNCAKIILSNKSFKYNVNLVFNNENWTPLHFLINRGIIDQELFELLLQSGNISENYLYYMIENKIEIELYFSSLIKHKIGIGKKQFKPKFLLNKMVNNNSFIKAIIKNGFYIIENNKSIFISNPVIFSITNNLIDLTKSLLNHYDQMIKEQDENNKTCLFHAIDNSNMEYFNLLLHHTKIDIEERNCQGITALEYALEKQEKEKVKLLLQKYISIHEEEQENKKKESKKLIKQLNSHFTLIYDKLLVSMKEIKGDSNKGHEYDNIKKIIQSENSKTLKNEITDIKSQNSQNDLSNVNNNNNIANNKLNNIHDNNNRDDKNQDKKANVIKNNNNNKNIKKNKKNKNKQKNNKINNVNDDCRNNQDNNENNHNLEDTIILKDKINNPNTKDGKSDNINSEDENIMKHYQEIHLACFNENEEIIQLLVGEFNYDIDEPYHDGSTPLLLCLKHEKYKCINILLENNANITKVDQQGESALSYVLRHPSTKNNEVLKLFLPKIDLYQIYSPEDLIPLHYLIKYNNYQGMEMIFQHLKNLSIDDCRFGGNDDNIKDTLLLYAIKMYPKHLKVIEIILREGANVNYLNKEDKNPLIIAIEQNDMDLIQLLLKYKADINFKTNTGLTPLKVAIKNNLNLIVKEFIKYNKK